MPLQPYRTRQIRRADTGEVVYEVDNPVDGNVLLRQALNAGVPLKGLDFLGLDLRGIPLKGQDLSGCNFTKTVIDGMDLSGCDLTGANLHWVKARGVIFDNAVLDGARMSSFDGTGSSFRNVRGKGVNFSCAELDHTQFDGAELPESNFELVKMHCASLNGLQAQGSEFRRAKLGHAKMVKAGLQNCTFTAASLYGTQMDGSVITGSSLVDADLMDACCAGTHFDAPANAEEAEAGPVLFSDRSILPDGVLANALGTGNLRDHQSGKPFEFEGVSARSGWHDFVVKGEADDSLQANDRVVLDFPSPIDRAPGTIHQIRPAYEREREDADNILKAGPPKRPEGSRTQTTPDGPTAV
ncbi:MAG: hypothetical protein Alpg2KO_01650 [Alphaproteobacteria bacterium]